MNVRHSRRESSGNDTINGMHPSEPHALGSAQRLNRLRAGVLGANDGIVSVAALVVGVAGATTASGTILTAGAAGLVGGAISMGLGEYVSVNSQRDSQQAMITEERRELQQNPQEELDELVQLYVAKGLTPTTAQQVAEQLTARDPVAAHLDAELNLVSEEDIANPAAAALTSAGSFAVGGALPFLTMLLLPSSDESRGHLHRRSAGPSPDREPGRPARGQPAAETDYSGGGRRRNRSGGHLRTGRSPWQHRDRLSGWLVSLPCRSASSVEHPDEHLSTASHSVSNACRTGKTAYSSRLRT